MSEEPEQTRLLQVKRFEKALHTPFLTDRDFLSLGWATFGWLGWQRPNIFQSQRYLVVMDGEIFNREDFPSSQTDAERVAKEVECRGFVSTLEKINGDFSIVIFDGDDRTLWLGRDRFGIKPLYYIGLPHRFCFSSRPKALLRAQERGAVDSSYVLRIAGSHYRYFDNEPSRSPYLGIHQVEPAHWIQWKDGQVTKGSYWRLQDKEDFQTSEELLANQYRELLADSVKRRMLVARSPTFTLSGGMDSSSVLATAVSSANKKLPAFSAVYSDRTFDESHEIRTSAEFLVSKWHPISIDPPSILEIVHEMVHLHDEPVATATWLSHFLLLKEVRAQGFDALFGGMGGDELNAGEFEYFFYYFADLKIAGRERELEEEIEGWKEHHDHPIYRKNRGVLEDVWRETVDFANPGHCRSLSSRLFRYRDAISSYHKDLMEFQPVMEHPFRSYLNNRTYQDLTRETSPCCLRAEDRNAEALGIMHFLPFFDYRIVEFMFRVPGEYKIRKGVTKQLLRKAMQGVLPEATRTRIKKTGWNAPAHLWFSGKRGQELLEIIHSQKFRERGIYQMDRVEKLFSEHQEIVLSGKPMENHMMFFWQLLNLELWLRDVEEFQNAGRQS